LGKGKHGIRKDSETVKFVTIHYSNGLNVQEILIPPGYMCKHQRTNGRSWQIQVIDNWLNNQAGRYSRKPIEDGWYIMRVRNRFRKPSMCRPAINIQCLFARESDKRSSPKKETHF